MADHEWLRPAAASKRFSVHRDTLAAWANAGLIGRSKVGRCVFYRAADVADLIASRETRRAVVPKAAPLTATPSTEPAWVADFWATGAERSFRRQEQEQTT